MHGAAALGRLPFITALSQVWLTVHSALCAVQAPGFPAQPHPGLSHDMDNIDSCKAYSLHVMVGPLGSHLDVL